MSWEAAARIWFRGSV